MAHTFDMHVIGMPSKIQNRVCISFPVSFPHTEPLQNQIRFSSIAISVNSCEAFKEGKVKKQTEEGFLECSFTVLGYNNRIWSLCPSYTGQSGFFSYFSFPRIDYGTHNRNMRGKQKHSTLVHCKEEEIDIRPTTSASKKVGNSSRSDLFPIPSCLQPSRRVGRKLCKRDLGILSINSVTQ